MILSFGEAWRQIANVCAVLICREFRFERLEGVRRNHGSVVLDAVRKGASEAAQLLGSAEGDSEGKGQVA